MPDGVLIRDLDPEDVPGVLAFIAAERGGDVGEWRHVLRQGSGDERHIVLALLDDQVIGFAYAKRVNQQPRGPVAGPAGWYLSGVTVAPRHRRRGIGRALTQPRLIRLRARTDVVFYATEADNSASLALHRRFGFEDTGCLIEMPGASRPLALHRLILRQD